MTIVLASMHWRVIKILWCHYGFRGRATRIATYRVQKTVSMSLWITISDCLIVYPLCQEWPVLMLLLDKKYLSLLLLAVAPRSRQRNYNAKGVRGCRPWHRQISQRLNFQIEDSIVLDLVPQELADLRRRFSTLRAVQSSEEFSEASKGCHVSWIEVCQPIIYQWFLPAGSSVYACLSRIFWKWSLCVNTWAHVQKVARI